MGSEAQLHGAMISALMWAMPGRLSEPVPTPIHFRVLRRENEAVMIAVAGPPDGPIMGLAFMEGARATPVREELRQNLLADLDLLNV